MIQPPTPPDGHDVVLDGLAWREGLAMPYQVPPAPTIALAEPILIRWDPAAPARVTLNARRRMLRPGIAMLVRWQGYSSWMHGLVRVRAVGSQSMAAEIWDCDALTAMSPAPERDAERVPLNLPCAVEVIESEAYPSGMRIDAAIVNISDAGAGIRIDSKLRKDEQVLLRIMGAEAAGTVAHAEPGAPRIGIKLDPDPRYKGFPDRVRTLAKANEQMDRLANQPPPEPERQSKFWSKRDRR